MLRLSFFSAMLLVIPAPLLAQITIVETPTKVAPTKVSRNRDDLDQIQCRIQDTTGTRLDRHQVCLTKQQWLQYERDESDYIELIQSRAAAPASG